MKTAPGAVPFLSLSGAKVAYLARLYVKTKGCGFPRKSRKTALFFGTRKAAGAVCKTSIPGSIPGGASKFTEQS